MPTITDPHLQKTNDDNLLSQEELLCYRPVSQACHAYCKAAGLDQDLVVAVTTMIIFFLVVGLVGVFLWVNHRGTEKGSSWEILPGLPLSSGQKEKEKEGDLERWGGGGGDGEGDVEGGHKAGYTVMDMDMLYSDSDGDSDGDRSDGNNKNKGDGDGER